MENIFVEPLKKKCPKCGAFLLSQKCCDTCGLQLWVDILGAPFGERSLYGLREEYWEGQNFLVKLYPRFEKKISKRAFWYKKSLFRRFHILIEFFLSETKISQAQKKFFFIELRELTFELLEYGVKKEALLDKLDKYAKNEKLTAFTQQIMSWIIEKQGY